MSIQAVAWALEQRVEDASAKLVLIALCNAYNGRNGRCDPSRARLALEASCSLRTVDRKLQWLADEGWITAVPAFDKTGRQSSNVYYLNMDGETDNLAAVGGRQSDAPGRHSYDEGEGDNCVAPLKKPEYIPEDIPPYSPPKGDNADQVEKDFQILWDSWPRKKGTSRLKALSAYRRLSKKLRDQCFEGGIAYSDEQAARIARDPPSEQFCLHLSTFINQRRWETITEAAE